MIQQQVDKITLKRLFEAAAGEEWREAIPAISYSMCGAFPPTVKANYAFLAASTLNPRW